MMMEEQNSESATAEYNKVGQLFDASIICVSLT
jgi:hypothetical protein